MFILLYIEDIWVTIGGLADAAQASGIPSIAIQAHNTSIRVFRIAGNSGDCERKKC